jgi:DNA-binding transcriptional LysR family regulator
MDIRDLREYVQLSREMNFTKAAQKLHLSQSALSNHIMNIEKEMGIVLVNRSHPKITLTVAGYKFLESASKIIRIYDSFVDDNRKTSLSDSNHFVIQTVQHVNQSTFVLLSRIEQFKRLHPDAQIEIRESLASDVLENMHKGIVDCGWLGVGFHDPQLEEDVIAVPMSVEELIVWLDKSSPLHSSEALSPKDLEGYELPTWVGTGPNRLENLYQEVFADYGVCFNYSPRYCISREDYFLNKIYPNDAVILTEGAEQVHSIRARGDRGLRGFNPPIFVKTFIAFRRTDAGGAIGEFRDYLLRMYEEDPKAELTDLA